MAKAINTRHPFEWAYDSAGAAMMRSDPAAMDKSPVVIQRIGVQDLVASLREGVADFLAGRTDAIFLCLMYPLAGLVLSRLVIGGGLLPLVFPLVAGFALMGPLLATGIYQMSRVRQRTGQATWADAFSAFGSPAIGSIMTLGVWLLVVYLLWLGAAGMIYRATLGPIPPKTYADFLHMVFLTSSGWALIVVGVGVGAVFAAAVLTVGVVSFPLLLDRNTGVGRAVEASIRAVRMNPGPITLWGAMVAGLLVLGSLPFLIGLAFVVPVLGHATWHLYRRLVAAV